MVTSGIWILISLTLTGLILKLYAIYLCYHGWRHYRQYWYMTETGFCIIFSALIFGHIILELYSYYSLYHPPALTLVTAVPLLKLYYALIIAILLSLPVVLDIVILRKSSISKTVFLATLWAILTIGLFSTDLFIAGMKRLPQGYTRIPGPYYGVMTIALTMPLFYSVIRLINIARGTEDKLARIKAYNILIGIGLLTFVLVTVVILMALGIPINGLGLIPFSMGVLILILATQFNHARLFDLRTFIPGTKKWRLFWNQTRHIHTVSTDPGDYRNLIDNYTDSLIKTAEKVCDSQREIANYIGVSQATVSRRTKKQGYKAGSRKQK